jgi:peptide/nickel transport system ATP-binding protein
MALLETKKSAHVLHHQARIIKAVNGVSYAIEPSRRWALSANPAPANPLRQELLRLLDGNGYIDSGEIFFEGRDLTKLPMSEMYHIRAIKFL